MYKEIYILILIYGQIIEIPASGADRKSIHIIMIFKINSFQKMCAVARKGWEGTIIV